MDRAQKRLIQKLGSLTINKVAVASVTSGIPLPPVTGSTTLVVEHIGRRTGKSHRTPMGYASRPDGSVDVVSEHGQDADWVKNAMRAGEVLVWIGGKRFKGIPRVDPGKDPQEVWSKMKSRSVAGFGRLLAHRPKVVHITLEPLP